MQTYNDVLAEIQSFSLNGKLRLCHTHRSVELQDLQNVIVKNNNISYNLCYNKTIYLGRTWEKPVTYKHYG
ncbi:MAG: hypothetical protein HCA25_16190 [Dolichospermum sp. DET50]|jgi:hypothetical protein|nr:hypothetical protein [Dolichospermum sp. DET66]MBS3033769.1 hypothetical protein [Dolichospermum sp. DET67]MBS3038972.1 hypothetical protein [Dolichospermum sp. DET50]QSX66226.1 MAG: hypothetical protein EZY12_15455 [Dolichospermum sp. DET69]